MQVKKMYQIDAGNAGFFTNPALAPIIPGGYTTTGNAGFLEYPAMINAGLIRARRSGPTLQALTKLQFKINDRQRRIFFVPGVIILESLILTPDFHNAGFLQYPAFASNDFR